jgi:hypothetical protein
VGSKFKWTEEQREAAARADQAASVIAFWKSDKRGLPSNGGSASEAAKPGLVQTESGPLVICRPGALHATLQPEKWRGERLWIVALYGEVLWQDDKCAALKREILGEVL